MIRFHQTFGAHAGKSYEFRKSVVHFGRMPDCDVVFDAHADIDASGHHAEVRLEPAGYLVVDGGSRNGTFLNGVRVDRALLTNGDEIEFGPGGPRMRVDLSASLGTGPMTPLPDKVPAAPQSWGPPSSSAPGSGFPPPPHVPNMVPPPPKVPNIDSPAAKKYGNKTVAMMIQSAVNQARSGESSPRSTAYFRAVANEAADNSSRGLKIAVGCLSVMFLGALSLVAALLVWNWYEGEENRRETERLSDQIDQGPPGERIAEQYRHAIFMLVESRPTQERGICTAFALGPTLLGTNAHCVAAIEEGRQSGATYLAVQNGASQNRIPVTEVIRHPSYSPNSANPSADVGLVRLGGVTTVQVALANSTQLTELRTGETVFVYGFPGRLANVTSPVATITNGLVGRMTRFDGTQGDFLSEQLIQHSASTSPGTSGSPIFNDDGVVVGVNAGSFRSAARQDVLGPGRSNQQTVVTESGYNFGIRADVLSALSASTGH